MITVFNIILISLVYMVTLDSCCCLLVISVRQKGISQVRPPESRKGLSPAFKDRVFQFGVFYYSRISLAGTTWLLSVNYKRGIPKPQGS